MERLLDKLDKLDDHLQRIDVTLAKQEVSLSEHIRRTELIENDLVPIKGHVERVNGAMRFIGFIALLVSLTGGIIKIVTLVLQR